MSQSVVELDGLTKFYGTLKALDNVTLRVMDGVTGLLGPNGAGKTTLIKALLGLVRVSQGLGRVLGFDIRRQGKEIRRRIGLMPEDDSYLPGLTGVQMLRFAARLSGLPSREALRRAHEILDFAGIGEERYREVNTYSVGMRQKLKFAQAIVHDPSFVILDEPTSGLDPDERRAMLSRLRMLVQKSGKAILISTHLLYDVQEICDSIVILGRGRVLVQDSLENLRKPRDRAYTIRVLGDASPLEKRLSALGVSVTVEGGDSVTATDASGDLIQKVFSIARETGLGIRRVSPSRNSLEEIFIQATQEQTGSSEDGR